LRESGVGGVDRRGGGVGRGSGKGGVGEESVKRGETMEGARGRGRRRG